MTERELILENARIAFMLRVITLGQYLDIVFGSEDAQKNAS